MQSTSAAALLGMSAAQTRLQASARNIANLSAEGFPRERVSPTAALSGGAGASLAQPSASRNSLEMDVVGLLRARNSFLANLAVFRTDNRMTGSLLDALT
jgi:flagellar basal body rod protein FlgG